MKVLDAFLENIRIAESLTRNPKYMHLGSSLLQWSQKSRLKWTAWCRWMLLLQEMNSHTGVRVEGEWRHSSLPESPLSEQQHHARPSPCANSGSSTRVYFFGSKFFTKFDTRHGNHSLEQESSFLTTVRDPIERCRLLCLPFGLVCS